MLPALLFAAATSLATPSPADMANIDLAKTIVSRVGDRIWPQWSRTPFAIDLLTGHGSALIGLTMASPPPSFPTDLEATFPLANGVQTIVIGEPALTAARTPVRWTVTLLHEHFHQWQFSWPSYYPSVAALGLAPKGDSGMWMLDYPFPYKDARVGKNYAAMSAALAAAIGATGTPAFSEDVAAYRAARAAFRAGLTPGQYTYFAFQCWQEGVARYAEYATASLAVEEHKYDAAFLTPEQAAGLDADAARTYEGILKQLTTFTLAQNGRVNFYSLGAGEALLLDVLHPGWREKYLDARMDLSVFF